MECNLYLNKVVKKDVEKSAANYGSMVYMRDSY